MRLAAALALVALGAAPAAADPGAPDRADLSWRFELGMAVVVPVWQQAYEDATSFGGRVVFRAARGHLATQVDFDLLSRDNGPAFEQLGYRTRGLAGLRWRSEPEARRAIEVRAIAGVEVAGLDRISSDWAADRYGFGFAAEVGIENRNRLEWGTVAFGLSLGLGVQPFGDEDRGQARYVGLDILFGFTVAR